MRQSADWRAVVGGRFAAGAPALFRRSLRVPLLCSRSEIREEEPVIPAANQAASPLAGHQERACTGNRLWPPSDIHLDAKDAGGLAAFGNQRRGIRNSWGNSGNLPPLLFCKFLSGSA